MIDKRALYAISAGVYLLTTRDGERAVGRVVDAVSQVAADPKRVSVSLMKSGHTSGVIAVAGVGARFVLTVLAEDAPLGLVKAFGLQSSDSVDKFDGYTAAQDEAGVPYVADGAVAQMSCEVFDILDMGSHLLVLADVVEAQVFGPAEPMTYAGYRKLKAGEKKVAEVAAEAEAAPTVAAAIEASAPAPAPAAEPAAAPAPAPRIGWRCTICGMVIERDELPANFTCPVCGVGRELFERIEL